MEMMAFSPSPCSRNVCIQYSKLDTVKTMGTHGKIDAIWWNIKVNVQKLADICGYELPTNVYSFTQKYLTEVKLFQKVLLGATFSEIPCSYYSRLIGRLRLGFADILVSLMLSYARCLSNSWASCLFVRSASVEHRLQPPLPLGSVFGQRQAVSGCAHRFSSPVPQCARAVQLLLLRLSREAQEAKAERCRLHLAFQLATYTTTRTGRAGELGYYSIKELRTIARPRTCSSNFYWRSSFIYFSILLGSWLAARGYLRLSAL